MQNDGADDTEDDDDDDGDDYDDHNEDEDDEEENSCAFTVSDRSDPNLAQIKIAAK